MKTDIFDATLTPQDCEERGYEYLTDIIYSPSTSHETSQELESILKKGSKLGLPKKTEGASEKIKNMLYGLYEPLTKEKRFLRTITVDESLTPETAESRGYEWVEDGIFFDPAAGGDLNKEAIQYTKLGFKLGSLADRRTIFEKAGTYFGLYKPLKK